MTRATPRVLGRLLVAAGAVSDGDVDAALDEQRRTRERLGEILVRRGLDPEAVARALAAQLRIPFAGPSLAPAPDALRLVDAALARRLRVLPLAATERTLRVAMADPLDLAALDDLQFQTGRRIEPAVAVPAAVERALAEAYAPRDVQAVLGRLPTPAVPAPSAGSDDDLRQAADAPPIVALVELILQRAAAERASDVHIEPGAPVRVRARVDGVLRELLRLPDHTAPAVVSRIKIMAGLDIAVKRRPQDGRGTVRVDGRELWLRVSTLPANGAEKVVLRLLAPDHAGQPLADLGLGGRDLPRLLDLLGRGHGVLLVTGPTGSGKTTTLYAALGALDRERRNVVTLEDPVEYRLAGLTQVQVHRKAGLGFAGALRAVLRQDPDIIMVGEMRDRATVEVGMAAALTGHLVLSTLHTNDAPSSIARLLDMGAPPYLVAGGLIGILAQRLVRRLCPDCRAPHTAAPDEIAGLGLPPRAIRHFHARGCPRCAGEGYRGRIGIFELLVVDARMRELILRRAPTDALRDAALADGSTTLGQDAWRKVADGLTTIDEVRPLLSLLADEAPACPDCSAPLRREFLACPRCGRTLRRRCRCGAPIEPGWRCCAMCGAPAPTAVGPREPDASAVS